MRRKIFPDKLIEWTKQAIEGGRVGININGTPKSYFRSFKGLRQGDPLSPLLFNLVGDALDAILSNAKKERMIKGLVPHFFSWWDHSSIICR